MIYERFARNAYRSNESGQCSLPTPYLSYDTTISPVDLKSGSKQCKSLSI